MNISIYISVQFWSNLLIVNISERRIKFLAGLHLLTVLFNTYFIMNVEFKMRLVLRRRTSEIISTTILLQCKLSENKRDIKLRFFALYDYVFFSFF